MACVRVEQERNGARFDRALMLETRHRTRTIMQDVAAAIGPGMIEEDAVALMRRSLKAADMLRGWHGIHVRFGRNTLKNFGDASEPGVVLGENDIFFIDIGPVWREHEGDAGATFAVGEDAEMHRATRDVKAIFDATRARWQDGGVTGAELYRFAEAKAARLGWVMNLDMAGHRLSDFPHAVKHDGALLDTDYAPGDGLWVLEIQIRHPDRPFSAFYEDLLLQGCGPSAIHPNPDTENDRLTAEREQHMTYGDLSFDQTEKLMSRIGGMNGLYKLLSGEWIVGEPAGIQKTTGSEIIADLLEVVGDQVKIAARERFIARDSFAPGGNGELPISLLGDDFTENFLGLVEEGVKPADLRQYKLVKSTVDGPIFVALGGESKAKVALAHVFDFLKTADRARWFFFYVTDVNGILWAIDTYWRDDGWDIEAYSVTYPRGWRGGGRVVSN